MRGKGVGMAKKLSRQAKKQLLNLAFLVLLVGITAAILVASQSELNFENIGAFLSSANPWMIVAAFGCMLLFVVAEGLSLYVILRRLGHRGKLVSSLAYSAADVYYSAITPSATGGQPASAYYMLRDGIGAGTSTFALIFNLIAYTAAILIMGATAFLLRPSLLGGVESGFSRFLVIAGFVVLGALLSSSIAFIFCRKAVLWLGRKIVVLLAKLRIVRHREKWEKKLSDEVEKYHAGLLVIKAHPTLIFEALLLNLCQRVAQIMITCFVCAAADPSASFVDLFSMQCFVLLGYNSVPLPGGVGAFEYLYLNIYSTHFEQAFILSAMMISRVISYYVCLIVSGIFMVIYHAAGIRKYKRGTDSASRDDGSNIKGTEEVQDENNV